ncbi:alanine racemase [Lactobacillus sp. CC-MHH1034]|uniref:alanine racemase n=1 Tax=Agrilactobacillus fermenti TaxID=2586909 RepID=UPI001E2E20AE|nr:alanine racemase [Agrilactobacillus fermenti]MCD2255958.1 alanine racemase [Agrilactobacillus fermenti]
MVVGNLRNAQVVIDRQAIKYNVREEVKRLKQGTELFAVVKADGYGHGMVPVAQAAQAAGATGFCVAILDEALGLREAHFTAPILVLGITRPELAEIAASQHISLTVGSKDWLVAAKNAMTKQSHIEPLAVHLGIDSGMGRIGFTQVVDFLAAVAFIKQNPEYFIFEGIFTHFATADEQDTTYFQQQVKKFNAYVAQLDQRPRYVHVSNSATSLWHDACNGNMVRFGVAIYGLNPSGTAISELPYPLQPALSLTSEIVFCKQIHAGDSVSYGATYTAKADEYIGTVPMGYADGWLRRLQGFHVLVDGHPCEIVGRICMDQFMIRLPKPYDVGTKVTLIGEDQGAEITLQEVAAYSDTIHYELACILTNRLPRKYIN